MTRALPFTEASLRRAISAARKAGLHVIGIRPDGTLMVSDVVVDNPDVPNQDDLDGGSAEIARWRDIQT